VAGCAKLPATISGRLLDTSNNPLLRCAAHETLNYRNSKSTQRLIFGSPNKTGCVRPETITGSHQLNRGGHGSGVESGRIRPAFPDPEPFDIFESSNSLAEVKTLLSFGCIDCCQSLNRSRMFSSLKKFRTRIKKFWNRRGVGKCDSGHLCN